MNKILTRVFELLPEKYLKDAVIAGGAAVDLAKATDIDVFILNIGDDDDVQNLTDALTAENIPGLTLSDPSKTNPSYAEHFKVIAEIEPDYCMGFFGEDPVNDLTLPVQIIGSPANNIRDVLRDFDLSCHCCAITADGEWKSILEYTPVTETIRAVKPYYPDLTLLRYRKFCKRYGIEPDGAELVKICKLPDPVKKSEMEALA